MGELAYRLTGSSDLYQDDGRGPYSSVNFITAHDRFTLADLVSYNEKHNEANGEENRDGADDNVSWNCGAEGLAADEDIRALRHRQVRNLLATLLLSQGTPMISGGDEVGRTQRGNNNAYCQDNEISWFNWSLDDDHRAILAFTRKLIALRHAHPALRRAKFFKGREIHGTAVRDLMWFNFDGREMNDGDWGTAWAKSLAMFLAGKGLDTMDDQGQPVEDDDLLVIIHGGHEPLDFTLPDVGTGHGAWELLVDTSKDDARESTDSGQVSTLGGRSLKLFRRRS
jgi:isoamylase